MQERTSLPWMLEHPVSALITPSHIGSLSKICVHQLIMFEPKEEFLQSEGKTTGLG